jgi:predicted transcriptional regulator
MGHDKIARTADYNPRRATVEVISNILEALKGSQIPLTVFEITRACDKVHGTAMASVRMTLKRLINEGRVQRVGERRSYRYQLAPDTSGNEG